MGEGDPGLREAGPGRAAPAGGASSSWAARASASGPLAEFFPGFDACNRGFGGSQVADSLRFCDRIVFPRRPRTIVFYAGDNDIAAGKTAATVARDFQAFAARVHGELPRTGILYIAIKPSLSRWHLVGEMRRANALIRAITEKDRRLAFVDIDGPMLGPDGRPRPEFFVKDGLHLNEKGYAPLERPGPAPPAFPLPLGPAAGGHLPVPGGK